MAFLKDGPMIKLPIRYYVKTIPRQELMKTWSFEEVLTYCKSCNNYGKNYSCPDFTDDTEELLEQFDYVTLILTETSSKPIHEKFDELSSYDFSSRVSDQQDRKDSDLVSQIAMYIFNEVKDSISGLLLEAEKIFFGYSSPPGACTKCRTCFKNLGQPCIHEEELRYSLEALGFLVSDIYKAFFNKELGWTSGQLPEAFHTCSGLFTVKALDPDQVCQWLNERYMEVTID